MFSFGNGETHHNNKYMGTKKHQLNGVELTCTAIGIEIGNFAVNSPHPFLSSYIVILQYHPYHKYTQNHYIKIIHQLIYCMDENGLSIPSLL